MYETYDFFILLSKIGHYTDKPVIKYNDQLLTWAIK